MLERGKMERGIFEIVDTESLVPKEHLLRKIDEAVDFNKIYDMVEPLYCADNGRPSVDPVVLFKMVLIQHLYGLGSLRRTAEEVSYNVAYRWFLGYRLQEDIINRFAGAFQLVIQLLCVGNIAIQIAFSGRIFP